MTKVWLTDDLLDKIRAIFEPKYGRVLTMFELEEIAENLTKYLQIITKEVSENGRSRERYNK